MSTYRYLGDAWSNGQDRGEFTLHDGEVPYLRVSAVGGAECYTLTGKSLRLLGFAILRETGGMEEQP